MPVSVMIAAALLGTAQPDGLRQLSTKELRAKVRESTITRVHAPPYTSLEREAFWSGGRYAGEFDNYEPYGTYRIARGQVCIRAERDPEDCFSILVDREGQYWMTKPKWHGSVRVIIEKIANRH